MCGIAGELRWDGGPAAVADVARITAAMSSRGPDGDGVWAAGGVALGHRRLAIIDLSERGAQPTLAVRAPCCMKSLQTRIHRSSAPAFLSPLFHS